MLNRKLPARNGFAKCPRTTTHTNSNHPMTSDQSPVRVAIVGGGCAGMAAAFELSRPEHQGRYQITVYQQGWRLGGKGASGRGPNARIEEHGLHLWMGFYENAFRLMRECYEELDRPVRAPDCPIKTWRDAFSPAPLIGVTDRAPDGSWIPWMGSLPPAPGLPGDPPGERPAWTAQAYITRTLDLLRTLFQTIQLRLGETVNDGAASASPTGIEGALRTMIEHGQLATLAGMVEGAHLLEMALGSLGGRSDNLLLKFIDDMAANARDVLESRLQDNWELKRVWEVIDLTLATLRGEVRFGVFTNPDGFDVIDDYDCREWLLLNGASPTSVDSGFVRGLYDLGFSYEDADVTQPRISAGQSLRAMVRAFFTYRGSFFWRMNAGMGDIVFAPFYEVLQRRGVRFEFFHRLENVRLADGEEIEPGEKRYVKALDFDIQADPVDGEYAPLVNIRGLPCWPSQPRFEQLLDGERLAREGVDFESHWDRRKVGSKTLRVTDDFDFVVLAIGLGAVPHVCSEIVATDPDWRAMVDHVKTVATQAFQTWMKPDMAELGWPHGPINVSGFVEPFDTWADMTHLVPAEDWPRPEPRAIAYFCSVLSDLADGDRDDADYPARQRAAVRQNAVEFLRRDVAQLWPGARAANGDFDWSILVSASPAPPTPECVDGQFWTANVNPSDRYVLSLPGSTKYRISPLDDRYDNLTIAGDWTNCGFNAGCVEAAVMSGRLAAHALSRSPRLEDIAGYDHP